MFCLHLPGPRRKSLSHFFFQICMLSDPLKMVFLIFGGYFFVCPIIYLVLPNMPCDFLYSRGEYFYSQSYHRIILYICRVVFDIGLSNIVTLGADMFLSLRLHPKDCGGLTNEQKEITTKLSILCRFSQAEDIKEKDTYLSNSHILNILIKNFQQPWLQICGESSQEKKS